MKPILEKMKMFGSRKKKAGTVPVFLNVYDLTSMNGYAYWLGLGVYHSGVQVHGVEYAFGAHELPTTGIFEGDPRQCPGFTFRKCIQIGRTDLDPKEVRTFMEKLAEEYTGNTYNLITKNCNHFCNDACIRMTGKSIPRWVNRLARIGLLCTCVLPADLQEVKLKQNNCRSRKEENVREEEKKKLRSRSSRSSSSSVSSPRSSSSCCSIFRGGEKQRKPPPSPQSQSSSTSSPLVVSSSSPTKSEELSQPKLMN